MEKLTKDLAALVPFQEKYRNETQKTVARIELAITLTSNDVNIAAPERPVRVARFKDQISAIHGRAPLSLANVIKAAETGLSAEQVKAARDKMAARFADRLQGAPLDVVRIDALLVAPATSGNLPTLAKALAKADPPADQPQMVFTKVNPTPTPASPSPPRAATTPAPATNPPATPAPTPASAARPSPPASTTPPLPPPPKPSAAPATPAAPPPRVIGPAPPESEWNLFLEKSVTKYAFNADQKKVADRVFAQCKARAGEYLQKSKPEYESAAKISDPKAKAEKTAELNKPLDRLYDELVQRIESVASAEQKAKATKAQESAPPVVTPAGN
jgi:hypothetical protein